MDRITASQQILLEGNIKYRDNKQWKSRWAIITKPSPIADCLKVILFKNFKEKIKKNLPPKTIIEIENYLGIESGFTFEKESNTMAIICVKQTIVIAFETREILIQWQAKLQENFCKETHFLVHVMNVVPNKNNNKTICCGPYRLLLQDWIFCLVNGIPPRLTFHWSIKQLRRFGLVDGKFCFEGGSQCGKGAGLHILYTSQPEQLSKYFELASNGHLNSFVANLGNNKNFDSEIKDFELEKRQQQQRQRSLNSGSDSSTGGDSCCQESLSSNYCLGNDSNESTKINDGHHYHSSINLNQKCFDGHHHLDVICMRPRQCVAINNSCSFSSNTISRFSNIADKNDYPESTHYHRQNNRTKYSASFKADKNNQKNYYGCQRSLLCGVNDQVDRIRRKSLMKQQTTEIINCNHHDSSSWLSSQSPDNHKNCENDYSSIQKNRSNGISNDNNDIRNANPNGQQQSGNNTLSFFGSCERSQQNLNFDSMCECVNSENPKCPTETKNPVASANDAMKNYDIPRNICMNVLFCSKKPNGIGRNPSSLTSEEKSKNDSMNYYCTCHHQIELYNTENNNNIERAIIAANVDLDMDLNPGISSDLLDKKLCCCCNYMLPPKYNDDDDDDTDVSKEAGNGEQNEHFNEKTIITQHCATSCGECGRTLPDQNYHQTMQKKVQQSKCNGNNKINKNDKDNNNQKSDLSNHSIIKMEMLKPDSDVVEKLNSRNNSLTNRNYENMYFINTMQFYENMCFPLKNPSKCIISDDGQTTKTTTKTATTVLNLESIEESINSIIENDDDDSLLIVDEKVAEQKDDDDSVNKSSLSLSKLNDNNATVADNNDGDSHSEKNGIANEQENIQIGDSTTTTDSIDWMNTATTDTLTNNGYNHFLMDADETSNTVKRNSCILERNQTNQTHGKNEFKTGTI